MVTRSSSRTRPNRQQQQQVAPPAQSRPRRKPPAPPAPPKSPDRAGEEIVGRTIDILWPTTNTYYTAIVIEYAPRRRQHKVIYIEEEDIEVMELGSGPGRRSFRLLSDDDLGDDRDRDPLIGAEITLHDSKANGAAAGAGAGDAWFDFMRRDENDTAAPFNVRIYAAIDRDNVLQDEITGPSDPKSPHAKFYRVIHTPTDYLTTVDLAKAEYTLSSPAPPRDQQDADDDQDADPASTPPKAKNDEDDDNDDNGDYAAQKDDEAKVEDVDVDEPAPTPRQQPTTTSAATTLRSRTTRPTRTNAKKVVVAPAVTDLDEDDIPVDIDPTASIRNGNADDRERRLASSANKDASSPIKLDDDDDDFKPGTTVDLDDGNDRAKPPRSSRRVKAAADLERAARTRVGANGAPRRPATVAKGEGGEEIVADPLDDELQEIAAAARKKKGAKRDVKEEQEEDGEKGGTRGEKEEPLPLPSELYPDKFLDEKQEDTASDPDHLGLAAAKSEDAIPPPEDGGGGNKAPDNRPQVGDFISLDTGNGGERRNAFVEAYFPEFGTHFVAFCDPRGGHQQVKLTNDNYALIPDSEVENMTNNESLAPNDEEDEEDDVQITAVESRKTRGGRTSSGGRQTPAKRERDATTSSGGRGKKKVAKRQSSSGAKILGKSADSGIVSRCISMVWPGSKLVYVALVMGYSAETGQHILLYMVDHCVEVLDLRYREWELLPRGKEPWNSTGMVGKRIFVWWPGEYNETETQELAERIFGDETKVAYEAYVLAYSGKGVYKVIYPCNEDCEERELDLKKMTGNSKTDRDWDILEEGVNDVEGLPVIGWEG